MINGLSSTKGNLLLFSDICGNGGLATKKTSVTTGATKPAKTLCSEYPNPNKKNSWMQGSKI